MKNAWSDMNEKTRKDVFFFSEEYMDFLDAAKTEREACAYFMSLAENEGFVDFDDVISGKIDFKPGLKVIKNIHNKSFIAAIIGTEDPENGLKIVGSHIDSPRLDFKPRPYYEDSGIGYIKTHYYGGIKKYQWVTIPLSIHGIVIKKDGSYVDISIGEKDSDPVFTISDLLPHLSQEQIEQPVSKFIPAENLNIISGSLCFDTSDDEKDPLKKCLEDYFKKEYDIDADELLTAEFECVPAFKARDLGFDRSLIAAYGQDDRICAYSAFRALLDVKEIPQKTCICYCSDKEEIGSVGNTGAQSYAMSNFIAELCNFAHPDTAFISLRRCLANTKLLSADVTAAFDPTYANAYDKTNAAFCGKGLAVQKYTGARGKSSASDANAEYLAEVVNLFTENGIPWQINEMGRTDLGGGGTIAQYMANLGMSVIDCGTPILSMHAPYEISSKADLYYTYKGYSAFFNS